jgi:hypothetical protein
VLSSLSAIIASPLLRLRSSVAFFRAAFLSEPSSKKRGLFFLAACGGLAANQAVVGSATAYEASAGLGLDFKVS